MKTFFIQTFGCQMNVYDGMRIAAMLRAHNMTQTDSVSDADIIILNTCSIREKATNKVYSALGRIRKKKKPSALFGIVGCVARESGADAFRRIPELNFVLGPQSYHKLPEILSNPDTKLFNIDLGSLEKFDELPQPQTSELVAYIPIQEGCNHCCTYCIVPYTRGREVSRPFNDIMADTIHAANTGALEICFLGQNVNGYQYYCESDGITYRLSDLVKHAGQLDAIKRIRFTSNYPTEMTDDLIDLFRTEEKLLPVLHLPIQSGSSNVLTSMNRPNDINLYIDIARKLKSANPNIKISSDFIVGFPGETDDDFEQTVSIAKQIGYINSYSYKYSPRPYTGATKMQNQIPESEKSARLIKLESCLNDMQREFNTSCIGHDFECLCEGPDKTGQHLIYRTPYMQQCIIDMPADKNYQKMACIHITAANKASLRGEIVD